MSTKTMKRVALLLVLLGAPVFCHATTYYISQTAAGVTCSDSNTSTQAQSKTTPWCNAPGMPNATSNASSYTPVAGDVFAFRGCDTWTFAGQFNIKNGSSSTVITYGGTDQTWYNTTACPSAWNRPIFTGGGSWPGTATQAMVEFGSGHNNIRITEIEFTGALISVSAGALGQIKYVDLATTTGSEVDHNYFHGGTQSGTVTVSSSASFAIYGNSLSAGNGDLILLNIFDFTDSDGGADTNFQGAMNGTDASYTEIAENYYTGMDSCDVENHYLFHDNVLTNCAVPALSGTGLHANIMESNGDGTGAAYYNNLLITNDTQEPNGSPIAFQFGPTSNTSYAFGNVYGDGPGARNPFSCSLGSSGTVTTCLPFNNTIEPGRDSGTGLASNPAFESGDHSNGGTMQDEYNFVITSSGSSCATVNNGTCSETPSPNLIVSVATAHSDGYTLANFFAPTSTSNPTYQAGMSPSTLASLCNTIATFNSAAGAACRQDTTLGVTYNTSNHTLTFPARTPVNRLLTGAVNNDAGAYQFSAGSSTPSAPCPLCMAEVIEPVLPFPTF